MKTRDNKIIFETLNKQSHRVCEDTPYSLFDICDDTTKDNQSEYWYASDIYNTHPSPLFDIRKNIIYQISYKIDIPARSKINPIDLIHEHIIPIRNTYTINNNRGKHVKIIDGNDARLSRYACRHIAKNILQDTFLYAYFLSPSEPYDLVVQRAEFIERIHARDRLAHQERRLNGILTKMRCNIALFHHKTDPVFFGGITVDTIKQKHGIAQNEQISNYMNLIALNARTNAIETAITRFNISNTQNEITLTNILKTCLLTERTNMINKYNKRPEHTLSKIHINTARSVLNKFDANFVKTYATQKLR